MYAPDIYIKYMALIPDLYICIYSIQTKYLPLGVSKIKINKKQLELILSCLESKTQTVYTPDSTKGHWGSIRTDSPSSGSYG